jgi:hypothetical protein
MMALSFGGRQTDPRPGPRRPCESVAKVVAVARFRSQARTVARTASPYRARKGCDWEE